MREHHERFLWALIAFAVATRFVWAFHVHPPEDFVFKDMRGYVAHAQSLLEHGLRPNRSMVFQAPGTYWLLAIPFALFGAETLWPATLLWASFSAATVVFVYLLARRCTSQSTAIAVGLITLLWYPSLSSSGLFLSEAPFGCALTSAVWRLLVLTQDRRGAWGAGCLAALAIACRPEALLFFGACLLWFTWVRRGSPRWRKELAGLLLPIAVMTAVLLAHFQHHTGRFGGVAESATANLTPAKCHHPWIQAFDDEASFQASRSPRDGTVYGLIPLFEMKSQLSPDHPFAPRPAFGTTKSRFRVDVAREHGVETVSIRVSHDGTALKFVGNRADPDIHAALVAACQEKAGLRGQVRNDLVNLSALWFFNGQWPDNARDGQAFEPWSKAYIHAFQILLLVPMLFGMRLALGHPEHRMLAPAALALVSVMIVATVWFGSIRLRTPYDPFAILLAVVAYRHVWQTIRARGRPTSQDPN